MSLFKIAPILLSCSLLSAGLAQAQGQPFKAVPTNQLKVTDFGNPAVILEVALERLDKKKITTTGKGKTLKTWIGKRELPNKILYVAPTFVKKFTVVINGKKIAVPAKYWSDITGLNLQTAKKIREPKEGEDTLESFSMFLQAPYIIGSNDGKSAMISWTHAED